MQIALIGGTGFIGRYLLEELLDRGHQPALLIRPGSEAKVYRRESCLLVPGDVGSMEGIRKTLAGCDAVIYNIGLIRENLRRGITFEELQFKAAKRVMDAAGELGVERFILMSANGVRTDGTAYQRTKFLAEQFLKTTDLAWTIFRPSIIFGDPEGRVEFCTRLRDQLIFLPLPAPLFYEGLLPTDAGTFTMSPVHVKNVVTMFVKALSMPETIGKTYHVGGPREYSWRELIKLISQASGRNKWLVPVPAGFVKAVAALFDRFTSFPITRDQLTMLMEGNTCDSSEVFKLFDIDPIPFTIDNLRYLQAS
ncbi:MAG: complex I NDUFA9 subunit family protein [Fidelibacterota bacterium]|nr:MAG: complex I NDUFA9 subunit family protein [Candidatus Neomarinimicrobiota bacterium]